MGLLHQKQGGRLQSQSVDFTPREFFAALQSHTIEADGQFELQKTSR